MDYIYDIVLNFQDTYYEFYEWKSSDKIISVKRVPIYKIMTDDYLKIKNNYVTINKRSIPRENKMFLLTNGIEVMGIMIDKDGKVVKKSSLIFEEADEILEDKEIIKQIKIEYRVDKINRLVNISRLASEKNNYIENYLKKIDKDKDEYTLKYLYYDIFDEEEYDIEKVYKRIVELAKSDGDKLYECLKRVNLELKR